MSKSPAEQAWEHEDIQGRVADRFFHKHRQYLILRPHELTGTFHIVAYPKPEHMADFEGGAEHLFEGGPSYWYMGSVGSIEVQRNPDHFVVSGVQSHYSNKSMSIHFQNMAKARRLIERYHGWRVHGLKTLIDLARRSKLDVLLHKDLFANNALGKSKSFIDTDLPKICREMDVTHEQTKDGIWIRLKGKVSEVVPE